ncbi:MAG: glycosyltransferase family 2 protein, partial [bacterium]
MSLENQHTQNLTSKRTKAPPDQMAIPEISIVISTHNQNQALQKCLAAIQKSTCTCKIEVIIVDNGSKEEA